MKVAMDGNVIKRYAIMSGTDASIQVPRVWVLAQWALPAGAELSHFFRP